MQKVTFLHNLDHDGSDLQELELLKDMKESVQIILHNLKAMKQRRAKAGS